MAKARSQQKQPNSKKNISSFLADERIVDPGLASLFAGSLRTTPHTSEHVSEDTLPVASGRLKSTRAVSARNVANDEDMVLSGSDAEVHSSPIQEQPSKSLEETTSNSQSPGTGDVSKQGRKRKHLDAEDDIERTYMRRLAKDEAREEQHRRAEDSRKRHRQSRDDASKAEGPVLDLDVKQSRADSDERHEVEAQDHPQHETLKPSGEALELEKSARTVFLSNVSTSAITSKSSKKELVEHLASFLTALPKGDVPHKVESLRFRSTAFSRTSIPKKAAFAKKELMDATTKSTNAYVVYSTVSAAREAPKRLNGTVVLERHLRVDGVAHPAITDNRRCVFVGNLGFVDDESSLHAAEDEENKRKPRNPKQAADVEEGLWRQFSKAGTVESVRVIRDKSTRVGKGIAYVQFLDPNAVEAALLFNDKKYPPLLPRILRVTRAKSIKKTSSYIASGKPASRFSEGMGRTPHYDPRSTSEAKTLRGRAGKLLGHAGAAQLTSNVPKDGRARRRTESIQRTPESFVFEGYRASSKRGGKATLGGLSKKQMRPKTRSSRRGAAFKASGRKKVAA